MKILTHQENKIAHLVANGYIGKEIADKLYISPLTVSTHMRNIRTKLNAKNIADITRKYILSLPRPSDVFKTVLFLAIQINMIVELNDFDCKTARRASKGRARTTRVVKN